MPRPIKLPGLIGVLARHLEGLDNLSETFRPPIPTRSLRGWANNEREPMGFDASRVRDLCREKKIRPRLFLDPSNPGGYIASTADGWSAWTLKGRGWFDRENYKGPVADLVEANAAQTLAARSRGWPW